MQLLNLPSVRAVAEACVAAYWAWVEEIPEDEERSDWLITKLAANHAASLLPIPAVSLPQLQRAVRKIADQFSSLVRCFVQRVHDLVAESSKYRVHSIAVNGVCLFTGQSFPLVPSMLLPSFRVTQGTLMLYGLGLRSTLLRD